MPLSTPIGGLRVRKRASDEKDAEGQERPDDAPDARRPHDEGADEGHETRWQERKEVMATKPKPTPAQLAKEKRQAEGAARKAERAAPGSLPPTGTPKGRPRQGQQAQYGSRRGPAEDVGGMKPPLRVPITRPGTKPKPRPKPRPFPGR